MAKQSAGVLLYKRSTDGIHVLLAHPGGPYWKNKDLGSWTIPKGEFSEPESAFDAAIREFTEETGVELKGAFLELLPIRQKSGKKVYAWAYEKDLDPGSLRSNVFEMEWPPKSGQIKSFPELDTFAWFTIREAREKINPAQIALLDQLLAQQEQP